MSEMRELIDAELDAVVGGHGCCHGNHENQGNQGNQFDFGNIGSFSFGNFGFGNFVNFGNIVIQQNIAVQIGVAVGYNASVTNLLGSQANLSSSTCSAVRWTPAPSKARPHCVALYS